MGLLTVGKPLSYEETMKLSKYIREHGISQFLATWHRVKEIKDDQLKFGDEIECGIFAIDHTNKTVKLSIRSAELRALLSEKEIEHVHQTEGATWQPEFGAWMIESTPSRPYSNYANDLLRVERNMIIRRRRLLAALHSNEIAPTVTNFFLLGTDNSIDNPKEFSSIESESLYNPDYIINPHPRFAALTRNIRHRRGKKVDIRVPLYKDIHTPEFLLDGLSNQVLLHHPGFKKESDGNIHMDAMSFGMGMCCLVSIMY
jgi:glutamate--cysteine ligase catalytic subunit